MKDSYRELTAEELAVKREELRKQYNDARFNAIIGHVDNPLQERVLRRRLARAHTILREYQLGIRTKADAAAGKATTARRAAAAAEKAAKTPDAAGAAGAAKGQDAAGTAGSAKGPGTEAKE